MFQEFTDRALSIQVPRNILHRTQAVYSLYFACLSPRATLPSTSKLYKLAQSFGGTASSSVLKSRAVGLLIRCFAMWLFSDYLISCGRTWTANCLTQFSHIIQRLVSRSTTKPTTRIRAPLLNLTPHYNASITRMRS